MKDKEILAQLKTAYESLYDIIENGNQLQKEEINNLIKANNLLIDIYSNLWNETEENVQIQGEEDLTIGKEIYADYYDVGNDEFILKSNVIKNGKEYAWWQDYKFLTD